MQAEVFDPIYDNADIALKAMYSGHREIFVGKCMAIQEIRDAVDEIRFEELNKDEAQKS